MVPGFDTNLYDWVMGVSNGLKRLLRTIKAAKALEIGLAIEIPLLRSNIDMLESNLLFIHQLKTCLTKSISKTTPNTNI